MEQWLCGAEMKDTRTAFAMKIRQLSVWLEVDQREMGKYASHPKIAHQRRRSDACINKKKAVLTIDNR